MSVVVALLAIVVALLAVLVAGLLRTNAEVLRALDRLGANLEDEDSGTRRRDPQPGPSARTGRAGVDLSGGTLDGGARVVRTVDVEHDTLLLFLSSGCLTCRTFWDAMREAGGLGLPSRIRVVAVTKDLDEESPSALAELVPRHGASVVMSSAAWADYAVPGSPYAVLVEGRSGRVVGEGTGTTWDQVANLMAQATGDLAWVGDDTPRTRKASRDMAVERDTDAELLRAGITPGDPRLYPTDAHDADEPRGEDPV